MQTKLQKFKQSSTKQSSTIITFNGFTSASVSLTKPLTEDTARVSVHTF